MAEHSAHFDAQLFPPFWMMLTIDGLVTAGAIGLTVLTIVYRRTALRSSGRDGLILILAGTWVLASVYIADAYTMLILPHQIGMGPAMDQMQALHLGPGWYLHLIAVVLIIIGFVLILRFNAKTVTRLEDSLRELEAANRAKSDFLANMSHELRTPLNAILGFSEVIRDRALGERAATRYSEYAGDIVSSGQHLLALVNDLLDLARIESDRRMIDPRPLDPATVLEEVAAMMRVPAGNGQVSLVVHHDTALSGVDADERALKQVLINLLDNAIRAAPADSEVVLAAAPAVNGGARFRVADQGPGIPAAVVSAILSNRTIPRDAFTAGAADGNGLGLLIVAALVKRHGGDLNFERGTSGGTTVVVDLPTVV